MDVAATTQPSNASTQPALGVWFYFYYFTPPASLVGLSGLSR